MDVVEVEQVINAPVARVWQELADFGGIARYAPVSACKVEGEGVGMVRTVTGFGKSGSERLDDIDHEARVLRYSAVGANPLPIRYCVTTVEVSEEGGAAKVRWRSEVDAKVPMLVVRPILQAIYRGALNGLAKHLAKEDA